MSSKERFALASCAPLRLKTLPKRIVCLSHGPPTAKSWSVHKSEHREYPLLVWHLHALQAADAVGDERVHSFYPSLHANLGDVYLRLGNLTQAQEHIDKARETEHVLPDDGYGRLMRSLIIRLTQTINRDNSCG